MTGQSGTGLLRITSCLVFISTLSRTVLGSNLMTEVVSSVVTVAEFSTRSVACFFDIPPRCWCQWRISVSVKARVVNRKQVDVVVLI